MAQQATPIDAALVQALIASQFPQWATLPIRPVPRSGWDNRTFLVGTDKVARLPSAAAYEAQVNREQRWLPYLRPRLPLDVPLPLARGQPGEGYPWRWSIYRWIGGDAAASTTDIDATRLAQNLASFINAMHAVPSDGGPKPSQENFYRGGDLAVYDAQP